MTLSNEICKTLRKRKRFNSHTVHSRWTKLAVFSNTGLKRLVNHSEVLFSFLFSFHRTASNDTVSHEIIQIIRCNIKPRYQQSRLSLRYQTFPLLIQEGLCKVLEVEPSSQIHRTWTPTGLNTRKILACQSHFDLDVNSWIYNKKNNMLFLATCCV